MDHTTIITEPRVMDDTSYSQQMDDGQSIAPDTEPSESDLDKACEIERLSREAGIDPSSLTDEQVMEALYQMG